MKKIIKFLVCAFVLLVGTRQVQAQSIEEIQVKDYAKTDYVISAMKEFREAFTKVRAENAIESITEYKDKLFTYYKDQFGEEYKKKNSSKEAPLNMMFDNLDEDSIALQYYYIYDNSNPLGSKDMLNKAKDNSTWTKTHEKYYSRFHDYLKQFNLYDIFLVDLDTGDIVYTCFKELDFTTSLLTGPYAKSNIGDVFKAVKDSNDKEFTKIVDMAPYTPSYDLPARFVGTGVYDGDKKVGVLIFQLPPGM